MQTLAALFEVLLAFAILGCGVFLGWNHSPDLELGRKVPYMLGVLLSSFPVVGLVLYVYFWELNPRFSSACGKQGWLGLVYFVIFRLIGSAYPPDKW
jgi:hypothetical protein